MYFFIFFFVALLEIDRYRYNTDIISFYNVNIYNYIKSILNSIIFVLNYKKYIFDLNDFSLHNELVNNHDKIVNEIETAINNYNIINPGIFDKDFEQENSKYGYFFIKYYGNINTTILPTLKQLVDTNDKIYTCFVSIMSEDIYIPKHRGPYGGILRYHYTVLSDDTSNDYLSINSEKLFWKDKEGFLFDDTYLHFVEKRSQGLRISIIIDIERKLFFPLNLLNKYILSKIKTFDSTKYLQELCIPDEKPKLKIYD